MAKVKIDKGTGALHSWKHSKFVIETVHMPFGGGQKREKLEY